MNKIIFLDFDGVLVTRDEIIATHNWAVNHGGVRKEFLRGECVDILNKIIERTGAKIVVSSSWRMIHDISSFMSIFKENGCIGEVIDLTPKWKFVREKPGVIAGCHENRGQEIQQWIDDNVVNKTDFRYIIIDDDSDMLDQQMPFFIQTLSSVGLSLNHIEKSVSLLNT